jgi:hypothetical protein
MTLTQAINTPWITGFKRVSWGQDCWINLNKLANSSFSYDDLCADDWEVEPTPDFVSQAPKEAEHLAFIRRDMATEFTKALLATKSWGLEAIVRNAVKLTDLVLEELN